MFESVCSLSYLSTRLSIFNFFCVSFSSSQQVVYYGVPPTYLLSLSSPLLLCFHTSRINQTPPNNRQNALHHERILQNPRAGQAMGSYRSPNSRCDSHRHRCSTHAHHKQPEESGCLDECDWEWRKAVDVGTDRFEYGTYSTSSSLTFLPSSFLSAKKHLFLCQKKNLREENSSDRNRDNRPPNPSSS